MHNSLAGPSLIGAEVVGVTEGICASCQFTNDSTIVGCTIKVYNDEHIFNFHISRQAPRDTSLLKCFEVPTPGFFHVEVHEVSHDEKNYTMIMELPKVYISHKSVEQLSNGMSVLCAWILLQLFLNCSYLHTNYCTSGSSCTHISTGWSLYCAGDHSS